MARKGIDEDMFLRKELLIVIDGVLDDVNDVDELDGTEDGSVIFSTDNDEDYEALKQLIGE